MISLNQTQSHPPPTLLPSPFFVLRPLPERIHEFESLRAALAWWVVVEHVRNHNPLTWIPKSVDKLIWPGHAVDLFIMLSGFVIFLLLDTKRESYFLFITRRFFRLWPVFVVCFLSALLFTGFGSGNDWNVILFSNLTMTHGLVPESASPNVTTTVLPPSWSISLEWQFYLVAPFLLFLLRARLWVFVALLGLDLVLYQCLRATPDFVFPSVLPLRLHFFICGGFSYFLWKRAPCGPNRARVSLACALAGLAFLSTRSTSLTIWAGVLGYVVLKRMAPESGEESSNFFQRFTRWLGSISYSTYLCHWPIILLVERGLKEAGLIYENPLANFAVALVPVAILTLFTSWLLNVTVEKPGIDFGRRLAGRLVPKS